MVVVVVVVVMDQRWAGIADSRQTDRRDETRCVIMRCRKLVRLHAASGLRVSGPGVFTLRAHHLHTLDALHVAQCPFPPTFAK